MAIQLVLVDVPCGRTAGRIASSLLQIRPQILLERHATSIPEPSPGEASWPRNRSSREMPNNGIRASLRGVVRLTSTWASTLTVVVESPMIPEGLYPEH